MRNILLILSVLLFSGFCVTTENKEYIIIEQIGFSDKGLWPIYIYHRGDGVATHKHYPYQFKVDKEAYESVSLYVYDNASPDYRLKEECFNCYSISIIRDDSVLISYFTKSPRESQIYFKEFVKKIGDKECTAELVNCINLYILSNLKYIDKMKQ